MRWKFNYCRANLIKRKGRTLLTILGVAVGMVMVILMMAAGAGIRRDMENSIASVATDTQIFVYAKTIGEGERGYVLNNYALEQIQDIPYIKDIYPVWEIFAILHYEEYESYHPILAIPTENLEALMEEVDDSAVKPKLYVGNHFGSGFYNMNTNDTYEAIYGADLNRLVNKRLKSRLCFDSGNQDTRLELGGIISPDTAEMNYYSDKVFCSLESMHRLYPEEFDGKYSYFYVEVDSPERAEYVAKAIRDKGYKAECFGKELETYNKRIRMFETMFQVLGIVAFFVAIIGIANTMITSLYDKKEDIMILKRIGCDSADLIEIFFIESLCIGAMGGIIAVGLAILLKYPLNRILGEIMTTGECGDFIQLPASYLLVTVLGAVILSVIAGLLPIYMNNKKLN